MTISRIDTAVLQLRAQLQKLSQERAKTASIGGATGTPLQRLRKRGGSQEDEEAFRRAFVRALLTEEMGEGLANQAEFEAISLQVWRLLDEDEQMRALMDEAIAQLG